MNTDIKWNPKLYNDKHSFVYEYGKELISLLDPKPNETILDLGSGSGQLTYQIGKLVKKIIGIDSSENMVSDAKAKFPNIEFKVANITSFQSKQKFDSIFSNATLHWVKDHTAAINCMYQNLKPNGKIVLEFGGKGNLKPMINQLRKSLSKKNYIEQSKLDTWYFPSIGQYSTELEKAGFRVAMAEHFDRPTALEDKKNGIIDWLSMFAKQFFVNIDENNAKDIKDQVQRALKPNYFKDGKWILDYKRIRIIAIKE